MVSKKVKAFPSLRRKDVIFANMDVLWGAEDYEENWFRGAWLIQLQRMEA
jgi:hypothetical protein